VADAKREPTAADGPLIRSALDRAKQIDDAPTPERRRRAWLPFLATAAAALAEGFLRETMVGGVILFSLITIGFGATAGEVGWAVPLVVSGVAGAVLVFWAIAKRWSFGRQWAVLLGVPALQIVLIVVQWRTR
jgi:hypothetical protein